MSSDDDITLAAGPSGGLCVPRAPLELLWRLEAQGLRLGTDDTAISVRPGARLSESDRQDLCRWRSHVIALLTYQPPVCA